MQLRTRKLINADICRRGYIFDDIVTYTNGFTDYYLVSNNIKSDFRTKIRKLEFGHPPPNDDNNNNNNNNNNVTILLLGAKGVGKTSLVNTFINHILGIKPQDDNYMVKISAVDLENWITMYVFHQDTFSATLIDTPGFGPCNGPCEDENYNQFQTFLSRWCPTEHLVQRLNCIGVVLRVSDRHVHPNVLCHIPESLSNITHLFVTHGHGHEEQQNSYPIYAGVQAAAFHTMMYRAVHVFEERTTCGLDCNEEKCKNLFQILMSDNDNNNSKEDWWLLMFEILENRRKIKNLNKSISLIKHQALELIQQGDYLWGFNYLLDSNNTITDHAEVLEKYTNSVINLSIGKPNYEELVPKDVRDFLEAVFYYKKKEKVVGVGEGREETGL